MQSIQWVLIGWSALHLKQFGSESGENPLKCQGQGRGRAGTGAGQSLWCLVRAPHSSLRSLMSERNWNFLLVETFKLRSLIGHQRQSITGFSEKKRDKGVWVLWHIFYHALMLKDFYMYKIKICRFSLTSKNMQLWILYMLANFVQLAKLLVPWPQLGLSPFKIE